MRVTISEEDHAAGLRALRRAADYAGGSYSALAERIEGGTGYPISGQGIYKWISNGIPAEWAPRIEKALGGYVTRGELRPDLYRDMPDDPSA